MLQFLGNYQVFFVIIIERGDNMAFNHKDIEKKWQDIWQEQKTFKTTENGTDKYYALDMFPYPSGSGLHVGHPLGYTASDIVARMKRMQGYDVLHPMGWDAFGLPAEQYAIDTGNDPRDFTEENIKTFKRQLKMLGFSYDWDKEVNTSDPAFYKTTQWIFLKLKENGLAELKDIEVNWCEELGTVLANDEIEVNSKGEEVSERGGYPIVKKPMKQWVLNITKYADKLIAGLDDVNWPESTKEMQKNWIGKSIGLTYEIETTANCSLKAFTTRADTVYGITYYAISPEHKLVKQLTTPENKEFVENFIEKFKQSSTSNKFTTPEKSGVFTGSYGINPLTGEKAPIWIADYVLNEYGTGAVVACPSNDQRDFDFAVKYGLEIRSLMVEHTNTNEPYLLDGTHKIGITEGLNIKDAQEAVINKLVNMGKATKDVKYKLRDWIFSRQRFWGEPFPIKNGEAIAFNELPLELPNVEDFKAKGGNPPLANSKEWLENGYDLNTMPGSAGSSWYFLAYILKDENGYLDIDSPEAKERLNKWMPVDLYIGGPEHTVGHLLYSRFWNLFLSDIGILDHKEPFQKLIHQGMILGPGGQKMSKSKGNVINPDDVINEYGSDTLRAYCMFMGGFTDYKPWQTDGVAAMRKWLDRVWRFFTEDVKIINDECKELEKSYHKTVKAVTSDYDKNMYNTAISAMMTFINDGYKVKVISKTQAEGFLKLLNPVCPHITSELWNITLGNDSEISYSSWPTFDESKMIDETKEIVVQVNGKIRAKFVVPNNTAPDALKKLALKEENVQSHLTAKSKVVKVIPNKMVIIAG